MVQARRWWIGLVALAILFIAAVWTRTVPLELDIALRSFISLKDQILGGANVAVAGRDVTVEAEAFSPQGQKTVVDIVKATDGVRKVKDDTKLVPELKPFAWSATLDDAGVELAGAVPLPALRQNLIDTAKKAANGVTDEMEYGRGAPPRFDDMATLGVAQLEKLSQGKVSITDNKVAITGLAKDAAARDAVTAALRNLPEGFSLTENSVKAPPYVFGATKDAGTLTLNGSVPDDATRQSILAAVNRMFFADKVVDNLKVAPGAPANFGAATIALLNQLARLGSGSLSFSDTDAVLKGDALYDRAIEQIKTALAGALPGGFKATSDVTIKAPEAALDGPGCQRQFAALLGQGKILFDTNKASIDRASAAILDNLVAATQRCPSAKIEISGHTDATGSDETNKDLSLARAQQVVSYLVRAGVDGSRLTAAGYGKDKPVASNDTEEGRAQNRRIEFMVQE
jgi:OmpA-OmpF porin, OOP family